MDVKKRLAKLETPLTRAYGFVRHRVPVQRWDNAALEAFCARECKDLADLSDSELERLARDDSYDDGC